MVTCAYCGGQLPRGADARRKTCSQRCRTALYRRTQAERRERLEALVREGGTRTEILDVLATIH